MKASEGTASVGGFTLPKQSAAVRRVSALANVTGVTDLEPAPPPRFGPSVADVAPRPPRNRGGRGLAGLLAVSLVSAILASTGNAAPSAVSTTTTRGRGMAG